MAARARRRRVFRQRQAQQNILFTFNLFICLLNCLSTTRTVWAKERSSFWWEYIVNNTFTSHDWITNFRMSRATFMYVCNHLRPLITKKETVMRKSISAEKRLAITLYYLATNSDFRTVGHLFGVSKSSVCLIVQEVCATIVDVLLPKHLSFPSGDALRAVISGFHENHKFPQCVGAVDGCHIPIVSPPDCAADYYNRKGFHSVLLQGTVNHLGLFTDIYVGWPGRVHDARVFSNSILFKKGEQGTLLPNWTATISNVNVPLVLLGDPAYPLLPWLMKAFANNGQLSPQQRNFNYRLSNARVVVEHAYGRLKGRWRCLLKRNDITVENVPTLVATCCVLHNICESNGDAFDDSLLSDHNNSGSSNGTVPIGGSSDSKVIRDALMVHLSS